MRTYIRMLNPRLKAATLAGLVCLLAVGWSPVKAQDFEWETIEVEAVESEDTATSDRTTATTTEDPEIPVDELKLLVKPLTLEELENEAAAWRLLLKAKVQEISDAEIAIKRQNRQTQESQEAVTAIEKAQKALEEAEEAKKQATPGSREYETAIKKVEEAQTALEKAQEAVVEAVEAKEKLEEDEDSQKAIDEALNGDDEEGTEEEENAFFEEGEETREEAEEAANQLEDAAEALEEEVDEAAEGEVGAADSAEDLEEKAENLENISEQLEESAETTSDLKNELVVNVTELQEERTAIVDRFKAVLDEIEEKGGDAESYRNYIKAVSGIEIDVQDTEGLGVRIFGWLKSEEGGMRWVGNLGTFCGIVMASIILSQIAGAIVNFALKKFGGASKLLRQFIVILIKRGGIVVGVLVALTALEVSLGPILALLGGASFVLAFALQSNLGNLASGLMIMLYKPFDVGDEIQVVDLWGYVDSITLANTKIRSFSRQIISVPNNTIWNSVITNNTPPGLRKVDMSIRVPYDAPLDKVKQVYLDICKSHPLALEDPAPGFFPWKYEESSIQIGIGPFVETANYWTVYMDLFVQLPEKLAKEGISMAVQRDFRLKQMADATPSPGKVEHPEPPQDRSA